MVNDDHPLGRPLPRYKRQGRNHAVALQSIGSNVLAGVFGHVHLVVDALRVGVDLVKQRSEGIEYVEPAVLRHHTVPFPGFVFHWRQVAIEADPDIPSHVVDAALGARVDPAHSGASKPGSMSSPLTSSSARFSCNLAE